MTCPAIAVHDALTETRSSFPADHFVRFAVRPPIFADPAGVRVRIVDAEGVINVRIVDGCLEVSGRHALTIDPVSANTVRVSLRDSHPDLPADIGGD